MCLVDLALVIDESGSIQDQDPGNWATILGFLNNVVQRLDVSRVKIAMVTFGNEALTRFDFNSFTAKNDYLDAIRNSDYKGGNTNTTGALRQTRLEIFNADNGDRPNVPDVMIVVTDGNVTREVDDFGPEVQRVKNRDILILGVGVTNRIDVATMRAMVTAPPDQYYFFVEEFNELVNEIDNILSRSCQQLT